MFFYCFNKVESTPTYSRPTNNAKNELAFLKDYLVPFFPELPRYICNYCKAIFHLATIVYYLKLTIITCLTERLPRQ